MTRNDAIDVLKANYPDACFSELREAVDLAIKVLKEPEQKRGKWEDYPIADGCVQCSSCGVLRMGKPLSFFCPWCGADMREEKIDE